MKQLFLIIGCAMVLHNVQAQGNTIKIVDKMATQNGTSASIKAADLPSFHVALEKTTHIISPEPILYVDISSPKVEGNLPEKNIFRFKPDMAVMKPGEEFQVTIVTEQFVIVYKMTVDCNDPRETTVITINPNEAIQTNAYNKIGKADFDRLALLALTRKKKLHDLYSKDYGMKLLVNNIYVIGDFLLFDIGVMNKSKLQYDVDGIRFKLTDKKQTNAHLSQEIELRPLYQFYNNSEPITGKWRNFYLFRKFTYPGEKVFNIELTEKQLSGRKVSLNVDYNEVLHANYLL